METTDTHNIPSVGILDQGVSANMTQDEVGHDKRHDRGQATRDHILVTATRIFAEEGYEHASIDLVLRGSGISRGALYHHFTGKEALFAAVLESLEASIAQQVSTAARKAPNPATAIRVGCATWLTLAQEPTVRQIVLIDAPAALGWDAWRALDERYMLGLLKTALQQTMSAGGDVSGLVETYAHLLLAALIELALLIARAPDATAASHTGQVAIEHLIQSLLPRQSLDLEGA